jgi:hypothetical protein
VRARRGPLAPAALVAALTPVILTFASGGFPAPIAGAAGLRDVDDGWLVPAGVLARRLAAAPASAETDTVAPSSGRGTWLRLGRSELFGMPDLPVLALALGGSPGPLRFACRWQRMGRVLFVEDALDLEVAVAGRWRPRLRGGWHRLSLGARHSDAWPALAPGLTVPLAARLRLDVDVPLLAPPPWYGDRGLRRWLKLHGTVPRGLWAVAMDRRGDGAPVIQVEAVLAPGGPAAIGLRAEPATGSFGMTTAVRWRSWLLRSSHVVHPDLGPTHRWSLAAGAVEAIR